VKGAELVSIFLANTFVFLAKHPWRQKTHIGVETSKVTISTEHHILILIRVNSQMCNFLELQQRLKDDFGRSFPPFAQLLSPSQGVRFLSSSNDENKFRSGNNRS
jgi:hypothetical protein